VKHFFAILLLTGFCQIAHAQQSQFNDSIADFSFSYFVNGVPQTSPTAPNGFIQFPNTNAGSKSTITFIATSNALTTQPFTLTNASVTAGFSLLSTQTSLPIGGSGELQITFSPAASNPPQTTATGAFQFQLIGATGQTFNVLINLYATVLQPQLVLSYVDPVSGNSVVLSQGGILQFPNTALKSSSVAKIVVLNNGNGSGTVNSVSVSGTGFTLTNATLTPAAVAAGAMYTAAITFTPVASVAYTGTASINLGGVVTTFNLSGLGTSPAYTYSLLAVGGSTPIQPGATITLPATPADGVSKNSVTVQVQNTGNQAGTIATILELGSDFQLANLPVLPDTLNPGDIAVFNVIFEPAAAGTSTGRLQIGNDLFNLTGSALGSSLTLAVDVGLGPVTEANKATVSLPNTVAGAKQTIYIDVTNTGNQSTVVNGIGVTGTGFTVLSPPAPTTLAPAQTVQFTIQFAPVTATTVTGTVTVNGLSLTLLGNGQAPPALPAISITNVPSVLTPLQQPSAGVQLASTYPYDISGVLTLSFLSSSFVDDPSIQFATGGRTVSFTIPANTTQAVFYQASGASLGTLALFQVGTVAGTVSLTAGSLTVGQVNLTPTAAPSKSSQIPASVPVLESIQLQSFVGDQIVLLVTGYSTPRNLSTLTFQFTGAAGKNLQTSNLTLNVSGAFTSWYDSAASDVFGSQFSVTVTATVTGDPTALQGVSVTATNSQGTSAAQSVILQ
jgi:hypothetical protein